MPTVRCLQSWEATFLGRILTQMQKMCVYNVIVTTKIHRTKVLGELFNFLLHRSGFIDTFTIDAFTKPILINAFSH